MNKRMIIKMCINPHIIKTFLNLHCQFRKHEDYKVRNMVKCGLNIIINDHLVQHDGYYLVNSFIPPINTEAFRTVVKMVPGKGKNFFVNHTEGIRLAPISTYIAVTDKCMYHCWHCSASKFMKDATSNSQFSTLELKKIIAQLQRLGVAIIGFTGGEPLLRED